MKDIEEKDEQLFNKLFDQMRLEYKTLDCIIESAVSVAIRNGNREYEEIVRRARRLLDITKGC